MPEVAESLFLELKNAGHQVFFDKSRLEPGKPFSPGASGDAPA